MYNYFMKIIYKIIELKKITQWLCFMENLITFTLMKKLHEHKNNNSSKNKFACQHVLMGFIHKYRALQSICVVFYLFQTTKKIKRLKMLKMLKYLVDCICSNHCFLLRIEILTLYEICTCFFIDNVFRECCKGTL